MKSILSLFKALPIDNKGEKKADTNLFKETISKGFIFSPEVIYNYSDYDVLIEMVESVYGLTAEQLNNSFHKSWQKVKNTPMEQLVVEQIAHYLTTYGKEHPVEYLEEKEVQWDVDNLADKISNLPDIDIGKVLSRDANYIYIPKEVLNIPELEADNIRLVVIRGYTKVELKQKLLKLLSLGIALGEHTINDVIDVALFVGINEEDISSIKNKETKTILYDYLKLAPKNPIEFLRYLIYKATKKTLLIKSPELIEEIKASKNIDVTKLLVQYENKYGLKGLSEIFYRFKPLFLAFKLNPELNKIINKIRKLASKHHKPIEVDYLNTITPKLTRGEFINNGILKSELNRVNIFRKIRLAYALKFRTESRDSILYRIRNGKGYAKEFHFSDLERAKLTLDIITESITEDIYRKVNGKRIYIPEYMEYTLPATEKQFTGNFPSGSSISVTDNMIFGIYWENVNDNVIDLDLSMIGTDGNKIGWDADYRTESGNILFSGDMTHPDEGATELFYVGKQYETSLVMFVNYYNFNAGTEVPFNILVAKERTENFKMNYMVNPNNVLAITNSIINQKQKILGLVVTTDKGSKFYFTETYLGRSITASNSEFVNHSRKYLVDFYHNTISLNDILRKAGASMVKDNEECDVDLSPEKLEKDSILNLLA